MYRLHRIGFSILALVFATSATAQEISKNTSGVSPSDPRLRLGTSLYRVPGIIEAMAMSPDGKEIVICINARYFVVFSTASGKPIRSFVIASNVRNKKFYYTPDGKCLLTFGSDGIYSWNAADGKKIGRVVADDDDFFNRTFTISDDGTTAAIPSRNKTNVVHVYRMTDGVKICAVNPLQDSNFFHTLSANGTMVATWGELNGKSQQNAHNMSIPRSVHVWDVKTSKLIATLDTEFDAVSNARFSPDGKQIAVSVSGKVQLWDISTEKLARTMPVPLGFSNESNLLFSPDGKRLSRSAHDGYICTWDVASGKRLGQCSGPTFAPARLHYRPDGSMLAWGRIANSLVIWEATSGKLLTPSGGHYSPATRLYFTPDSKQLISIASNASPVFWDVGSGQEIQSIKSFAKNNLSTISVLIFSPDCQFLIGEGDREDGASLWKSCTKEEMFTLVSKSGLVEPNHLIVFSPNSRLLAGMSSRCYDEQHPITEIPIWDIESGIALRPLKGQPGDITSAAFSTDGEILSTSSCLDPSNERNSVELWSREVRTGKVVSKIQFQEQATVEMAFLDSRTFAAVVSEKRKPKIYDVYLGQEVRSFDEVESWQARILVVSPDQRLVGIGMIKLREDSEEGASRDKQRVVVYEAGIRLDS